jgi:hypothetical protein
MTRFAVLVLVVCCPLVATASVPDYGAATTAKPKSLVSTPEISTRQTGIIVLPVILPAIEVQTRKPGATAKPQIQYRKIWGSVLP